jgi:hypothetical protein
MNDPIFLHPALAPNLSDGDRKVIGAWPCYVPDPRDPGKLRHLVVSIEMTVKLMPEEVVLRQNTPSEENVSVHV